MNLFTRIAILAATTAAGFALGYFTAGVGLGQGLAVVGFLGGSLAFRWGREIMLQIVFDILWAVIRGLWAVIRY